MTMLLDERLRDLAKQTHLLEEKVNALGWMAANGAQTLKSMTRAQAHLMLAECELLDAIEANEKKENNNEQHHGACRELEAQPVQHQHRNHGHYLTGHAAYDGQTD